MRKELSTLLAFLLLPLFTCFAEELWTEIKIPHSPVSSLKSIDNTIYAGTEGKGIMRTKDVGKNWEILLSEAEGESVRKIVKGDGEAIFALVGDMKIYRSFDLGKSWSKISYFQEIKKVITNIEINSKGELYAAVDKAIYKSNSEGEAWKNITQGIEIKLVYAIGVSPIDELFAAMQGQYEGVFKKAEGNDKWIDCNEGLPLDLMANSFAFFRSNIVYADIEGKIYTSLDAGLSWRYLKKQFEAVRKMLLGDKGNLVVADMSKLNIYNKELDAWLDDYPELDFGMKIYDVEKDNYNKLLVATEKDMINSLVSIDKLFDQFYWAWNITVKDHNGNPIPGTGFEIYHVSNGNINQLKNETTNGAGVLTVGNSALKVGDELLISRVMQVSFAKKSGHTEVNDIQHRIKIDNAKLDKTGNISYLKLESSRIAETRVEHTTLLYNIIFGVQWNASDAYLKGFEKWIEEMNFFMYDIFDGQAQLGETVIYNNGENFDNCDVRIYASNMVHPCAHVGGIDEIGNTHVHMTRKWYGNSDDTRYYTAKNDYLSTYNAYHYTTIVHELGHYALAFYDEYVYVDSVKAKLIPKTYNYGFMDYQYPNGDSWSSEMSNPTRYPDALHKITAQHYWNGEDCWNDFEGKYEFNWGGIFCPIVKPSERADLWGEDYQIGPVGKSPNFPNNFVNFFHKNTIINNAQPAMEVPIVCKDNFGYNLGETHAVLDKTPGKLYQGKSANNGNMIIVGADVGDFIYLTYTDDTDFSFWISKYTVIQSMMSKKEKPLAEIAEIKMKKGEGEFRMVSSIEYAGTSTPQLKLRVQNQFDRDIFTEIDLMEGKPDVLNFKFDNIKEVYAGNFPDNFKKNGEFFLNAIDNAGEEFLIPFNYNVIRIANLQNSYDGAFLAYLDTKGKEDDDVAILACDFLTSSMGVDKEAIHCSGVYSIFSYPNSISKGSNLISIAYKKKNISIEDEESLRIFKWNDKKSSWEFAGGAVDTTLKVVSSQINEEGIFTVFTTLKHTNVDEGRSFENNDIEVYPNPSRGEFVLRFYLDETSSVSIELCDLQGRVIRSLLEEYLQNGLNLIRIDESLPQGEYLCKIMINNKMYVKKIVFVN